MFLKLLFGQCSFCYCDNTERRSPSWLLFKIDLETTLISYGISGISITSAPPATPAPKAASLTGDPLSQQR